MSSGYGRDPNPARAQGDFSEPLDLVHSANPNHASTAFCSAPIAISTYGSMLPTSEKPTNGLTTDTTTEASETTMSSVTAGRGKNRALRNTTPMSSQPDKYRGYVRALPKA